MNEFEESINFLLTEVYRMNPSFEKLYPLEGFVLFDANEKHREDALFLRLWSKYSGDTILLVNNGVEVHREFE